MCVSVCVCMEGGREGLVGGGKERKREREREREKKNVRE